MDAYGAGYDNESVGPDKGTIRDISMYVTGHQVDPFWHANPLIASTLGVYDAWGVGNTVSPDGNYIILEDQSTTIGISFAGIPAGSPLVYEDYPILLLAKIIRNGDTISYAPVTYLPAGGAEWSTDSKHILLGDEIYNLGTSAGSYSKISSVEDGRPDGEVFRREILLNLKMGLAI